MSFPGHIMVVDDDEDILEIVKLTLEMEPGLQVTCCNSGKMALAMQLIFTPMLWQLMDKKKRADRGDG